jgi:hypothetical protein
MWWICWLGHAAWKKSWRRYAVILYMSNLSFFFCSYISFFLPVLVLILLERINNGFKMFWFWVLLVEETRENRWPVASHWQTLSCCIEYTSTWVGFEPTTLVVIICRRGDTPRFALPLFNYRTVNSFTINLTIFFMNLDWYSNLVIQLDMETVILLNFIN